MVSKKRISRWISVMLALTLLLSGMISALSKNTAYADPVTPVASSGNTQTNIAPQATATASSVFSGYSVSAVNDGVVDGYPGDSSKEWASSWEKAGAWVQLTWSGAQTINQISLYDRPNTNDQVTSGTLTFSDGSFVSVDALPNDASSPANVSFADKTVTWVKFTVDSVSTSTANSGLAEFQVFSGSGSSLPAAPTGITATAGDSQVSLSWTASSGATGYNIGRSTTSGGPYTTNASGVTSRPGRRACAWRTASQLYGGAEFLDGRVWLPAKSKAVALSAFEDIGSVAIGGSNFG